MQERTSRKESPAACIMLGKRLCGVKLLHDPLWNQYLIDKIIQLQGVAAGRSHASDPEGRFQADQARDVVTELLAMREEWRHANGT